ncbi:hypothetical protein BKA70DRAFT_1447654 [Coprinopsis sp. MPI-PUGE-AT-0042]|nr:hypothetical protein BKA70DRAFT_1447654 [Coprinopsis sp. MPI-PUGE-AT-0042]
MDINVDPVSMPLDSGIPMDIVKGGTAVVTPKTAPFLIRAFVKRLLGIFRLPHTEDAADARNKKDATLWELLTALRDTSSPSPLAFAGLEHYLARFLFKPSSPNSSGDETFISIILPKSALATPTTAAGGSSATELNIKGANATQAGGAGSVGWKNAMRDVGRECDDGFGRERDRDRDSFGRERDGKDEESGIGANSSNWRGGSEPLTFVSSRSGRGRGARGGRSGGGTFAGRDRDFAGRNTGRDSGRNRDFAGRDRDFAGREREDRHPPLHADQELDSFPVAALARPSLVVLRPLDVVAVTLLLPDVEDEPILHPDVADEMTHLRFAGERGVKSVIVEWSFRRMRQSSSALQARLSQLDFSVGMIFKDVKSDM